MSTHTKKNQENILQWNYKKLKNYFFYSHIERNNVIYFLVLEYKYQNYFYFNSATHHDRYQLNADKRHHLRASIPTLSHLSNRGQL